MSTLRSTPSKIDRGSSNVRPRIVPLLVDREHAPPRACSPDGGLGGSTSRALRIGGELAAWRERDNGVTQTLMSIGAAAYWYPSVRRRFYLRGGAALVMHRASDGTDVVTSSGIGPQMGVGIEYPVSGAWLLAPVAHYSVGVFASAYLRGT